MRYAHLFGSIKYYESSRNNSSRHYIVSCGLTHRLERILLSILVMPFFSVKVRVRVSIYLVIADYTEIMCPCTSISFLLFLFLFTISEME